MTGPEGLRAAGRALVYWQTRQQVNVHNLANVETTGFRGRRVFTALGDGGVPEVGVAVDGRAGSFRETGAPLDLALVGDGQLVVRSGGREEYVRSGSFALDGDGRVIDERGRALMGENGPLLLPPGPITIDGAGTVSVAGEPVATLRIEYDDELSAGPGGVRLGEPGPSPAEEAVSGRPLTTGGPPTDRGTLVRQGFLEGSNVGALESLIEMSVIQRSHEAVHGSVRTLDSMLDTIVNRLGRVG